MPNHHRVEVRSIDGHRALGIGSMSGLQRGSWQLSVTKIWGSFVRRQGSRLGGFNGAIQFESFRGARGHAESFVSSRPARRRSLSYWQQILGKFSMWHVDRSLEIEKFG
jgi:hypothetical protein